jgi:hypothetical protein
MTSAINPTTVSTTFPIAGQDNNTQGFRDNFSSIVSNFTTAKSEITALQSVAIIKADLPTQTTPVINNLLGSTLSNGLYQTWSGTFYGASGVSGAVNIDLSVGAVQRFLMSANATFTFALTGSTTGWPTYSGKSVYSNAIILLKSDGNGVYTPTFATTGGQVAFDTDFPYIPGTSTQGVKVGGEQIASISVGAKGQGYTSPTIIGFTGGSPQTGSSLPTASATYTAIGTGFSNLVPVTTTGTPAYTVTNFNSITITATTGTAGTATLTFAAQPVPPYTNGTSILVSGLAPSAYNGVYVVTNCTTTQVSYASATTGSMTQAGTITTGQPGNNYAVGDSVCVTGNPDAVFTVASLANYFSGTLTNSSPTINNVYNFTNLAQGMTITGTGIPASTTISAINLGSPGSIQMSNNATTSQTIIITYVRTTGPIATLSGTPTGEYLAPLTDLRQLQTMTGIGSGARALINNGIADIYITNPGDGYTASAPSITFTGGGGVGSGATAVLTSGTATKTKAIEAWTVNGGVNVYLRYLGEY